jgi:hypothetical protein
VRERDHNLYEGRDVAPVLPILCPLAVDDLVEVGHDLGRLARDEEQRDAYEDNGKVVLAALPAARAVVARVRRHRGIKNGTGGTTVPRGGRGGRLRLRR